MLRYNTLYQSLKKVSAEWHAGSIQWNYNWNYIKFFHDNTFIYATINGDDFNQINNWFIKDAENIIQGTFEFKTQYQLILKFNNNNNIKVVAGITLDDKLLIEGIQSWEIYTPIH